MGDLERADVRRNRARISEAALEVFRERGIQAEIREIADRAGLGIATIYRYFSSKDELIMETVRDKLIETMEVVDQLALLDDPLEALKQILTQELALVDYLGGLSEALNARPPRALMDDLRGEWEDFRAAEPFEQLIRKAVEQGTLRGDLDIPVAAAMLSGLVLKRNGQPPLANRRPEDLAKDAFALFLRAASEDGGKAPSTYAR
jgi:AcrR family transcriptional regulator